ncbi:MAG: class I SAM-dependent methyltransferase [Bacteroidota bacterium]
MIIRKILYLFSYLNYRLRSSSKFKVHSPFVYELYTAVILDRTRKAVYNKIEKQRSALLRQRSLLETTDFGAGACSEAYKTRFRQVKNITRHSSVSPKFGQLFHRMVDFGSPKEILEIGTAMGISTMYIASAAPESRVITMEGCAVIAEKARENFNSLELNNIELDLGNFNNLLTKTLDKFDKLDFVLVDGNHRKGPSLKYFEMILPKLHPDSIVMIDDIHWSKGMKEAWEQIKEHKEVSISIDLFRTGILLFRKDIAKEDFILRF